MSKKPVIGISHGDINSIAYEIIIKSLQDHRMSELCTSVIYGSPKIAAYHKKALHLEDLNFNNIRHASEAHPKNVNIINCIDDNVRVELGKSTQQAGEASFAALKNAVQELKNNTIEALVTAPINKKNIQSDQFRYSGHTEYLQDMFKVEEVLMLMVSEFLRIGVVAGHVPIGELSSFITKKKVLDKIRLLNQSLKMDFGIHKPRIAVLGLNPHAGNEGIIGKEEIEVIKPAIIEARKNNILVYGPFPADGFFGSRKYSKFDATLAMYHDQGLAPLKLVDFGRSVNWTLGLPIVRTSVDHGTADDIAGTGRADPASMHSAIALAEHLTRS